MREYMKLVESLLEGKADYSLYPGLDASRYSMVGPPDRWKAPSYLEPEKGQENVGYVMFSLDNNYIIPLARSDEHRTGYEVMFEFTKKKRYYKETPYLPDLNPRRFVPVFVHGANHLYYQDDIPDFLKAVRKYFDLGGKDGVLYGAGELGKSFKGVYLSDFVRLNGNVVVHPEEVSVNGERLLSELDLASKAVMHALQTKKPVDIRNAAKQCLVLHRIMSGPYFVLYGDEHSEFTKAYPKLIDQLTKAGDIEGIEKATFGFGGLQNRFHSSLKKIMSKDSSSWAKEDAVKFFGDVDALIRRITEN